MPANIRAINSILSSRAERGEAERSRGTCCCAYDSYRLRIVTAMYRNRAAPSIPAPPTITLSRGRDILYGCQLPCFHVSAQLSIAFLIAAGRRIASNPKPKKKAAIANSAGTSELLLTIAYLPKEVTPSEWLLDLALPRTRSSTCNASSSKSSRRFSIASLQPFPRHTLCYHHCRRGNAKSRLRSRHHSPVLL